MTKMYENHWLHKKANLLDLVECIEEFWKDQYLSNTNKLSILLDNEPDNSGLGTIF